MNIGFSVDNNFVKQLSVTITSILLNSNKEDEFNFYVLDGGILDYNKKAIEKLKSIKNFNIEYIKIRQEDFKKCPVFTHFTSAVYYRFKLPSLISSDKVLYMDCDILIKKSLSELYNTNLDDNYAAVIVDSVNVKNKLLKKNLNVEKYFNSGVMLLNLEKMRKDDIENKCFDFVEKHPDKIAFVDQCVLNAVFKEKVKFVDKKYNFLFINEIKRIKDLYKKHKNNIVVLHFAGPEKPWNIWTFHPCRNEYYNYLFKAFGIKGIFLCGLQSMLSVVHKFLRKINLTSKSFVWSFIN